MIKDGEELSKKITMYNKWQNRYDRYCHICDVLEYKRETVNDIYQWAQEYERAQKEKDEYQAKCREIEEALDCLPDDIKNLYIEIYINKKGFREKARKMNYSCTGLHNKIRRTADRVLKKRNAV